MTQAKLPRQTKPQAEIPERKTQQKNHKTQQKGSSHTGKLKQPEASDTDEEKQRSALNAEKRKQPAPNPGKRTKHRGKKTSRNAEQRRGQPYDDVFRTLLNTCPPLVLPVINEMFGEHYTGGEQIDFQSDWHHLNRQDGEGEKRITDSSFTVTGTEKKHYLLELQSTTDSSMLIRFFEYSTQIALEGREFTGDTLHVTIPNCGVLFLRSTRSTPDRMQIRIDTSGGAVSFDVQVMKTQQYTIDEIFDKSLFMLIPFYIFTHKKRFEEYNTNEDKLRELKTEYAGISDRLKNLKENGQLTEYEHRMVLDMSGKVLEYIAAKYDNVRKGAGEFMRGGIIETEATRIFNEGMRKGEARGEARGETRGIAIGQTEERISSVRNLMASTGWSVEQSFAALKISEKEQGEILLHI